MSHRLIRISFVPILLFASQVFALGLGEIRLESALNEPLRAQIELIGATEEEIASLKVELASSDAFARYGLDRPGWLADIDFAVQQNSAGEPVIGVSTLGPVTEPFVTVLIEANWSRGRVLREYTVLLDPPTFAPPPATETTQAVSPPVRATQSDAGQIERTPPEPPAREEPMPPPVHRVLG